MIRQVETQDKEAWYALDKHLPESVFDEKVRCGQGYVYTEDEKTIGVLRYNLFWDNTPFCTMPAATMSMTTTLPCPVLTSTSRGR